MRFDPAFPQLPQALDPITMGGLLQRRLFSQELVEHCVVGEKRYRPNKSFVLSYHVRLRNPVTDTCRERVLVARLGQPAEALSRPPAVPVNAAATTYLPETDMTVWSFPTDCKLPHLPHLLDSDFLQRHFSGMREMLSMDAAERILGIQPRVLHYLPEQSCMIRYTLDVEHLANGQRRKLVVYGKICRDHSGQGIHTVMQQLAKQLPGSALSLGYDRTLQVLWQTHVHGNPLNWEELNHDNCTKIAAIIGKCVAEFHQCRLQSEEQFGLHDIERELAECQRLAAQITPEWLRRLDDLIGRLKSAQASHSWPEQAVGPIHRDLKLANFLFSGQHANLIDLDNVCLGDPHYDLGSLLANLHLNGFRSGNDAGFVHEFNEQVILDYIANVPWQVTRPKLYWHVAAALIHEVIRRSMRQFDEGRIKLFDELLALSEEYVVRCEEARK